MKKSKIYKISYPLIVVFLLFGFLILFICVLAIRETLSEGFLETLKFVGITLIFPLPFIWYPIYLWKKRKEGRGFYWDDEGVVIDLKGAKIYWDEIESIRKSSLWFQILMRSTVIHPHYTNHEKIRLRRKKWMPTPGHSIDWILIEKPKEYHENLLKAWEEKRKLLQ